MNWTRRRHLLVFWSILCTLLTGVCCLFLVRIVVTDFLRFISCGIRIGRKAHIHERFVLFLSLSCIFGFKFSVSVVELSISVDFTDSHGFSIIKWFFLEIFRGDYRGTPKPIYDSTFTYFCFKCCVLCWYPLELLLVRVSSIVRPSVNSSVVSLTSVVTYVITVSYHWEPFVIWYYRDLIFHKVWLRFF